MSIRLDTFVDEATIRRVKGVIARAVCGEGLQLRQGRRPMADASAARGQAGGSDVQHHRGSEGARSAKSCSTATRRSADGKLRGQMKENKSKSCCSFITERRHLPGRRSSPTTREAVTEFYRTRATRAPRSASRRSRRSRLEGRPTRWIRLRIPVEEGERYTLGQVRDRAAARFAQDRVPRPVLQAEGGRRLQPRKAPQGLREGERAVRRVRASSSGRPTAMMFRAAIDIETGRADRSRRHRRRSWTSPSR